MRHLFLLLILLLSLALPTAGQDDVAADDEIVDEFVDDEFADDEFLDDEFADDEFLDDEFLDDEFTDDELLDDEFLDDEFFDFEDDFDEFFDPTTGTYDEWLASDDVIDWDGDGDVDEDDFALLQWLFDDSTDDLDGDGFFDEEDFFLSQWLTSEDAADLNNDGLMDEDDYILFLEASGVFENEVYYVFIEPGFDRAVVEWETAEPGRIDTVRYRPVGQSEWLVAATVADSEAEFDELFEHVTVLTGLAGNTEYEILVRSVSVDGFATEPWDDSFRTRANADLRPAVILDLDYEIDAQEAWVFWETNRLTDARYALTRVSDGIVVARDTLNRDGDFVHDIELINLTAGTEYDLAIESVPVGLGGLAAEADVRDGETLRFATRSGGAAVRMLLPPFEVTGPKSALICAEFNQSVRLRIDYARVDNFRSQATNTTTARLYKDTISTSKARSHLVTIPKLKNDTAYRYRIVAFAANGDSFSTDPRGFDQWSNDWQFRTTTAADSLAPVIVEGPRIIARDRLAVLEWTTDVETTGKVFFGTHGGTYGTADEYSVADLTSNGSPAFFADHVVTLAGLDPSTTYQFRIESTAANGRKVVFTPGAQKRAGLRQPPGGAGSFTTNNTADTQLPVILSGPTVTSRTHNSAIVEWTTDEPANSNASFGVTDLSESVRSGDSGVKHKLVLSNLQPSAKYRYRVASTDATGNGPVQSAEGVFTTNASADLTAPTLTVAPRVVYKNHRNATLRWSTDEVSTARVSFGPTSAVSSRRDVSQTGTGHEATLTNLTPGTKYYFRVAATDLSNNGPVQSTLDSFVTDSSPDLSSPVLSDIRSSVADSLAVIRWQTDEVSDSFVEFGPDSLLLGARVGDSKDVTAHQIALTNLLPATRYYYKTGSIDPANNPVSESAVLSFVTLASPDTVAPDDPANLRATAGSGQAILNWSASVTADVDGYNIYRSTAGGAFSTLVTRVADTTYVDQGLSNGTSYRYRITAIDRAATPNESPGDTVSVQPTPSAAPTAPAPLTAQGSVLTPTLVFSNATPFQTGASLTYTVQVSTDSAFTTFAASVSGLAQGAGTSESGKTAWTLARKLTENATFYWRVRAEEGRLLGPFSATRRFVTRREAEATLTGDFNGDRTVNFDDFFLFVDAFGKSASAAGAVYDMDNTGAVDFGDFFLFVDNFGKTASSKRWIAASETDPSARFALRALGDDGGRKAIVHLEAEQVDDLRAFGLMLQYDADRVRFTGLAAGQLLEQGGEAPLLHVLSQEQGRIVLGNGLVDGGRVSGAGRLAQLHFDVLGDAGNAVFSPTAFVARSDGKARRVAPFAAARLTPRSYRLGNNYPNPFNPATSIDYALPVDSPVRLTVFDILGRPIRTLVNEGMLPAGYYRAGWDARAASGHSVASGVYFYVLEAQNFRQTHRMVLVK